MKIMKVMDIYVSLCIIRGTSKHLKCK